MADKIDRDEIIAEAINKEWPRLWKIGDETADVVLKHEEGCNICNGKYPEECQERENLFQDHLDGEAVFVALQKPEIKNVLRTAIDLTLAEMGKAPSQTPTDKDSAILDAYGNGHRDGYSKGLEDGENLNLAAVLALLDAKIAEKNRIIKEGRNGNGKIWLTGEEIELEVLRELRAGIDELKSARDEGDGKE